jgi:putative ABC transport system permease protein
MNLFNLEMIRLGVTSLRLHKLRSLLTALGIIFGVAAVICMLSVSEGASADELRMIELLGTHNIIVNSVKPEQTQQVSEGDTQLLEYGITEEDILQIKGTLPHIKRMVPLKVISYSVRLHDKRYTADVLGTTPDFFETVNIKVSSGRVLSDLDDVNRNNVCVIGEDVRRNLFSYEDPLGQELLVTRQETTVPYTVVGVLEEVQTAGSPAKGVEERNLNKDVYIPYQAAAGRYGDTMMRRTSGSREFMKVAYSGLYITIDDIEKVREVSELVKRVLERNHPKVDFEVNVPLARLQLAEKKKANQQLLLGFIAGISLLVGGIGIMNIMLASVTERTREIGIRRALGAKQKQIAAQFLVETVLLSTFGGVVGVGLGYFGAYLISSSAWGETIVQPWAVVTSFTLSVMVGIICGMYPAMAAARLDPIEALRYE